MPGVVGERLALLALADFWKGPPMARRGRLAAAKFAEMGWMSFTG